MTPRTRTLRRAPPTTTTAPVPKPTGCPPPAQIDAMIAAVAAAQKAGGLSGGWLQYKDPGKLLDPLISIPATCLSKAQAVRIAALTKAQQVVAHKEELPWYERMIKAMLPVLKIGAGGAGLLVSGIALVYIAGRRTEVGRIATGTTGALGQAARKVAAPAVRAERARPGALRRQELRSAKARARAQVTETRRSLARAEAESRVRITRGRRPPIAGRVPRERVRTISRRQAAGEVASMRFVRAEAKRERLRALKARSR